MKGVTYTSRFGHKTTVSYKEAKAHAMEMARGMTAMPYEKALKHTNKKYFGGKLRGKDFR